MKNYKKSLFSITLLINIITIFLCTTTTYSMEESEGKHIWTIMNGGNDPLYIRFRLGEVGPNTRMFIPTANNNMLANRETIRLLHGESIALNLDTLPDNEKLRTRFWNWYPNEDIMNNKPIETSQRNLQSTKAYMMTKRQLLDNPDTNGSLMVINYPKNSELTMKIFSNLKEEEYIKIETQYSLPNKFTPVPLKLIKYSDPSVLQEEK